MPVFLTSKIRIEPRYKGFSAKSNSIFSSFRRNFEFRHKPSVKTCFFELLWFWSGRNDPCRQTRKRFAFCSAPKEMMLPRHSPYTSKSTDRRLRASSTRFTVALSVHGSLLTRKYSGMTGPKSDHAAFLFIQGSFSPLFKDYIPQHTGHIRAQACLKCKTRFSILISLRLDGI